MAGPRVAMVHYHLRPSGVTRVIENAVKALAAHEIQTVILSGEPPGKFSGDLANVCVVEGLGYNDACLGQSAENLSQRLATAAKNTLGGPPDLWHVHNHSLGKNLALSSTVAKLAADGQQLLLQIHDFAEDGRPGNYGFMVNNLAGGDSEALGATLYPQSKNVHYAPINHRDLSFLSAAGVAQDQLHYLPNAVAPPNPPEEEAAEPDAGGARIFLYVTRAIRRKNLGEFLLWSAMGGKDDRFEVSMAPRNPAARRIYNAWVAFAASLDLPVCFEVGRRRGLSFAEMTACAYALVSTSVAEGFGLAFLEPWLMQKRLLGRDLPEITTGITSAGVDLRGLYSRLSVPVAWIGEGALKERLISGFTKAMAAYGHEAPPEFTTKAWHAMIDNDAVDFGRLDEQLQEIVIRRVAQSREEGRRLQPCALEADGGADVLIRKNREIVLREFSLEEYGRRLMAIYRAVLESSAESGGSFSARKLLDRFLAPERFSLLRT